MKWTEPNKPSILSPYDHVLIDTPIGRGIIEWSDKSMVSHYEIMIGNSCIGYENTLEQAKAAFKAHIEKTVTELQEFLKQ